MRKFCSFSKIVLMATLATAMSASADMHDKFKITGDMWVGMVQGQGGTAWQGVHGINVTRMRFKFKAQISDNWVYKGRLTATSNGTGAPIFHESMFAGSNQLMANDTLTFGAQSHPLNDLYAITGHRWFDTKFVWHKRSLIKPWQSALSYKMKFGSKFSVKIFAGSAENPVNDDLGGRTFTEDNRDIQKEYYAMLGYMATENIGVFLGMGSVAPSNSETMLANEGHKMTRNNTNLIVTYKRNKHRAFIEYISQATKNGLPGTGQQDPQTKTGLGLMIHYMINDKWAAFFDMKTGYEKTTKGDAIELGTANSGRMAVGPAYYFAEKMKLAVLFETRSYNKDFSGQTDYKDDSQLRLQLAGTF